MPSQPQGTSQRPALLFDLDGTLVDSLSDIRASTNYVRSEFSLGPVDDSAVRRMVGDGLTRLLERALPNASGTDLERARSLWDPHHMAQCTQAAVCFPGVIEALAEFADAGHPLAVVTNKPTAFAEKIVRHLQLPITTIVGGDSTPRRKPDPAPIFAARTALELSDDTPAFMIGDGPQDILAGRAAGCGTVAALFGFKDADILRASEADTYWRAFAQPLQGWPLWPSTKSAKA